MPRRVQVPPTTPPPCEERGSLGLSPAVLAKREVTNKPTWCPVLKDPLLEDFDPWCDPYNPKTVTYKHIVKAHKVIKTTLPTTPLQKAHRSGIVPVNLHFKLETLHKTGSFLERNAICALRKLTAEEAEEGVFTASLGNWAMALAYQGGRLGIPVTVFLTIDSNVSTVRKCKEYGARVYVLGKTLTESRKKALDMIKDIGIGTYISGYDHPHAIAGAGTIGLEILEQLPEVDAILVPVGGGGLMAGVAAAVKHIKPDTLIYGVEPETSCCFFKALANERPYVTEVSGPLAVPKAGYNSFHTARSLIDKMVLVKDDWISRAMLQCIEEERFVSECAGAAAFAAMLSDPHVVPELRDKSVVCIISGGNTDHHTLPRAIERAMAVEGRFVAVKISLPMNDVHEYTKVMKIICNIGCNVIHYEMEPEWITEDDMNKMHVNMVCETRGVQHSCTFRRVLDRLFPQMCKFSEVPFCAPDKCPCFPKLWVL